MTEIRDTPYDCSGFIPSSSPGRLRSWQEMVRTEHCDRIKRLKRLAARLPASEQPLFYEAIIPKERLPFEYNVDIPVLRVVFPERVFFNTASALLRAEGDEIAGIVADSLRREPPDVTLFVAGHADERGDGDFNEALSIERADAIATRIFSKGVNLSSIWRVGFGEDMPLFAGSDDEAWGKNRRIEFLFAAKPEPISVWASDLQLDGLCHARNANESAACRAKLLMRPDYEVERVVSSQQKPKQKIIRSPRQKPIFKKPDLSPMTVKEIKSRLGNTVVVADPPNAAQRMVVIPSNAPRIILNPVNRLTESARVIY